MEVHGLNLLIVADYPFVAMKTRTLKTKTTDFDLLWTYKKIVDIYKPIS